jgi:hypothetical protein
MFLHAKLAFKIESFEITTTITIEQNKKQLSKRHRHDFNRLFIILNENQTS